MPTMFVIERSDFSARLSEMLRRAELDHLSRLELDNDALEREQVHATRQHPEESAAEIRDRAIYRLACLKYKIPKLAADSKADAAAVLNAHSRELSLIHTHLRELTAAHEHLPAIERGCDKLQASLDGIASALPVIEQNLADRIALLKAQQEAASARRQLALLDGIQCIVQHGDAMRVELKSAIETTRTPLRERTLFAIALILVALALLTLAPRAHGQTTTIRGAAKGSTAAASPTVRSVDANHNAMDFYCVGGCLGSGGAQDVNLLQFLGVTPSATNPIPFRLSNGTAFILPTTPSDTQPVSAVSLPLPALAATSTKQSDGSQKTQLVDGSGNVVGSTGNALDINIKSGNPTTMTATQATGTNLHTVVDSPTLPAGVGTVFNNQQAVTGSAVALATNSVKRACVKALVANTINVYLGTSGVTTSTGLELAPGDAACLPVSNTNLIYVIASTTGASVSWVAVN